MIIEDDSLKDKGNRALEQWVHEESVLVATELLHRLSPAVRQAMTTLDAIETGTQSLMRRIGRHITEVLMEFRSQSPPACVENVHPPCGRSMRAVPAVPSGFSESTRGSVRTWCARKDTGARPRRIGC